jgi:hypothetical protein
VTSPFRWNAHNADHVGRHGVAPVEAEYVIRRARAPFPRAIGDGKYLVRGQTENGDYLQVIFI